jgi:hypothetical protein
MRYRSSMDSDNDSDFSKSASTKGSGDMLPPELRSDAVVEEPGLTDRTIFSSNPTRRPLLMDALWNFDTGISRE